LPFTYWTSWPYQAACYSIRARIWNRISEEYVIFNILFKLAIYLYDLGVNARAQSLPSTPDTLPLKHGIFRITNKKGKEKIKSMPFTAAEWETVLKLSPFLFHEYGFLFLYLVMSLC